KPELSTECIRIYVKGAQGTISEAAVDGIRGTRPTVTCAILRYVTLVQRRATRGLATLVDVHARVAAPQAVIGVVARATLRGARAAGRRHREAVRRTRARGARAALRHVALARQARRYGPAHRAAGLENVHARVAAPQAVIG